MFLRTAADAAALFEPLFVHAEEERLCVAYLGEDGSLIAAEPVGAGGREQVDLPIRAIVAGALRLGAEGLVLAHNHPSGDPTPSEGDIVASRALAEVLARLGIRFQDHLVRGNGEWRSFRGLGLL